MKKLSLIIIMMMIVFITGSKIKKSYSFSNEDKENTVKVPIKEEITNPLVRFPFEDDGKWGYIDSKGNVIIPAQYRQACSFTAGVASALSLRRFVFINGRPCSDFESLPIQSYDRATMSDGTKISWLTPDGSIMRSQFHEVWHFCEGMAQVKQLQDGKWGFIDTTGKLVIDAKFDEAKSFLNSRAPVCLGTKWGFINKAGLSSLSRMLPAITDCTASF